MKKLLGFVLIGLFFSSLAFAQAKIRKIPFLPYTGTTVISENTAQTEAKRKNMENKDYETIYFKKDSYSLRNDQKEKIVKFAKRLKKEGGHHFSVIAYTTPQISPELARSRANTVIQALSDFKVGSPVIHYEYRESQVVNPNRVELHVEALTNSLGSASSNFGRR
jgi:hypothetical protein